MRWLDDASAVRSRFVSRAGASSPDPSRLWVQLGHKTRPLRVAYRNARERLMRPMMLRARLGWGTAPFCDGWFARGKPVHRYYVERFLSDNAVFIRGHCLEFQEDSYTTRFGGSQVTRVDVLHKEPDEHSRHATLFADLTRDNTLPSAVFDCIICTYVLHVVEDLSPFVCQLHRLLRVGGVLFVAVPNITVGYTEYAELWRFTPLGLRRILERSFGTGAVQTCSYGNSLTCAGEIRGLTESDFLPSELDFNDPRFGLVICARAVKGGAG